MDLEMTGLDADAHVIVEMATLLTTDDLEIIAEGPDLVIFASEQDLSKMGDFVTDMHTSSGLLDEIRHSTVSVDDAVAETLRFLRAHIDEPGTIPLCGNSIGTDRRFLVRHAPQLEDFFHYRSVDVSTIKELARRWNPEILNQVPEKASNHRALDDIRASVEELRAYKELFFIPRAN
jgi:oligoribonuclease